VWCEVAEVVLVAIWKAGRRECIAEDLDVTPISTAPPKRN
jgi:hypothetical protein